MPHSHRKESQDSPSDDSAPKRPISPLTMHQATSSNEKNFDELSLVLPGFCRPTRIESVDVDRKHRLEWLPKNYRSSEWVGLFYDLAVVAAINVFTINSEIDSPSKVGIFFSYFVVVWWIWTSQVFYDIRFEAEDRYHRFMKLLQLISFLYIGAASQGWSPTLILQSSDDNAPDATERYLAHHSFVAVAVAYAASRILLAFQYLNINLLAAKTSWRFRLVFITLGTTTAFSSICSIIAAGVEASSTGHVVVKVFFLYFGIFVEMVGEVVVALLPSYVSTSHDKVAERFSGFSLIILGEGIIGVLKAFNSALAGFNAGDGTTYVQVFLCLAIIYLCWSQLFSAFDKEFYVGRLRLSAWSVLNFPLHFMLFLLLSGLSNNVKLFALNHGLVWVVDQFSTALNNSVASLKPLSLQFGKLQLVPSLEEEINLLNLSMTENHTMTYIIQATQYFGQLVLLVAEDYNVKIEAEVSEKYNQLLGLNSTSPVGFTQEQQVESCNMAWELIMDMISSIFTSGFRSTLWLFPAAGGVIIMTTLLHMARYEQRGRHLRWLDFLQVCVGISLCLLGFLDLGNQYYSETVTFDIDFNATESIAPYAPSYHLAIGGWALPLVMLLYGATWIINLLVLSIVQFRKTRRETTAAKH